MLYISLKMIIIYLLFRFLPESPKWLMSQGKKTQAWIAMTKLVPSACHADSGNDNFQQDNEIRKVETYINYFVEFFNFDSIIFYSMILTHLRFKA